MWKKLILIALSFWLLCVVPAVAEMIGPVQPGTVITVDFRLPDSLYGAVWLDMALDYPRDALALIPSDAVQSDRFTAYQFDTGIPAGQVYSVQFFVLPGAAEGSYPVQLTILQALKRNAEEIFGLSRIAPAYVMVGSAAASQSSGRYCPQCGAFIEARLNAVFCMTCGARLDGGGVVPAPVRDVQVGDQVVFGCYEQDAVSSNGMEPIEWQVLDVRNGAALLISRYGLDARWFDKSHFLSGRGDYVYRGWAESDIRGWLNSTFLNTAFTAREQAGILTSSLTTGDFTGYHDGSDRSSGAFTYSATSNEWYWKKNGSISGGSDTQDKVFLLSVEEAQRYFPTNDARKCVPTRYAASKGAGQSDRLFLDGRACCWWWLRSPYYSELFCARVRFTGEINDSGYGIHSSLGSVRPALWVDCGYLQ